MDADDLLSRLPRFATVKYHQLKAFVTAVEEGSIRAAARRLHLTPAALTRAIRELEQTVEVALVMRSSRGVQLTRAGKQLNIHARLIVAEMQRARDSLARERGAIPAHVTVAITPAAALTILPDAFYTFRSRFPDAQVNIVEGFPASALPQLHDGTLDFAVLALSGNQQPAEFSHVELYKSRILIVARQGHGLESATSLAELVDADWLMNPVPESPSQMLLHAFSAHGLPAPKRIVGCQSYGISQSLLQGGDFLAAMPEQLLEFERKRGPVSVLDIREQLPEISLQLITRRETPLTPAASMLFDCLLDSARRHGLR